PGGLVPLGVGTGRHRPTQGQITTKGEKHMERYQPQDQEAAEQSPTRPNVEAIEGLAHQYGASFYAYWGVARMLDSFRWKDLRHEFDIEAEVQCPVQGRGGTACCPVGSADCRGCWRTGD